MPILLKTQIERTAKAPIPACHASVGSLCGFRSPAERVPTGSPKSGRCTAVRERCGNGKRRRRTPAGGFRQREKPQAAKQDISRLRELLQRHVALTGSKKGRAILEHFDERLADFKKIIPYDYSHMLQLIGRYETAGMTRDEAELEAFLKRGE